MQTSTQALTVSSMVPDITLPCEPAGPPVRLRECGGKITVLVFVHWAACPDCRGYVERLAASGREFEDWDARLLVVLPEAGRLPVAFATVVSDTGGVLAETGSAAVIVADRYGQVFHAYGAGTGHHFPPPREIEEWLKYLGTLCPE